MFTWFTRSRDWYLSRPALSFEAITLGMCLLAGLLLVPALIYLVGSLVLQAYANGGVFALYFDFLKGLIEFRPSCWIVLLGPFIAVSLLRTFAFTLRKI